MKKAKFKVGEKVKIINIDNMFRNSFGKEDIANRLIGLISIITKVYWGARNNMWLYDVNNTRFCFSDINFKSLDYKYKIEKFLKKIGK